jgi:hypothetical protein
MYRRCLLSRTHGGLAWGGSLAERYDAHQRSTAQAGHPDADTPDVAVEIAAASVLLEEGVERVEERHARECNPKPQRPCCGDHGGERLISISGNGSKMTSASRLA